jgi:hypothetical protein
MALRVVLAALCLLVLPPATAWAQSADTERLQDWMQAVVLLETGPSVCAGVLVDAQGTVATAYHCVASGRRPKVSTRDGLSGVGRLVATDARNDLALVRVDELSGQPSLEVREAALVQGERVWALGHPFGNEDSRGRAYEGLLRWSVSEGITSAVGPRLVQIDAALNPGNSGGPVVDEQGRVVGVASRKLRADNIGFIVPGALVLSLVEGERRKLPGGQYGLGLTAWLPSTIDQPTSIGVVASASLRDSLVLSLGGAIPFGQNWMALERGQASWVSAELGLSGRVRVGRGRWSTAADLGPMLLMKSTMTGEVLAERVSLLHASPSVQPAAQLRLELGGSALRWVVPFEGTRPSGLFLAIDVGFPGVIGTF